MSVARFDARAGNKICTRAFSFIPRQPKKTKTKIPMPPPITLKANNKNKILNVQIKSTVVVKFASRALSQMTDPMILYTPFHKPVNTI